MFAMTKKQKCQKIRWGNQGMFRKHMAEVEQSEGKPRDEHILNKVIREMDRRERYGADAYEIVGENKTLLPKGRYGHTGRFKGI